MKDLGTHLAETMWNTSSHNLQKWDRNSIQAIPFLIFAKTALQELRHPTEKMITIYADHCNGGGDLLPAPGGYREDLLPLDRDVCYIWEK